MSGFEWALVALGAAGAAAALIAFDATRRRRRRRNELVQDPDRSQLRERRIEVVPIDYVRSIPIPAPNPAPHERRDAYEQH